MYPRKRSLAAAVLFAFASLPAPSSAQGGDWPTLADAGIEYLSETGFFQLSFSGQLDLEIVQRAGERWPGLIGHSSSMEVAPNDISSCTGCHIDLDHSGGSQRAMAHRLRLFTDIFLGDHLYSLIEVRSDRGQAPSNGKIRARVEQAYLRVVDGAGALGLQAGRFASPFGSYALRHLTLADPFLRPPLPYEYRTVMSRKSFPENVDGLQSWQNWPLLFRSPGSPPIWDVPYQWGAMAFGRVGPVDLRAAAMNSAPSSDPADWGFDFDRFERPSWVLGARARLTPSVEVGASFNRGPWLEEPLFGSLVAPEPGRASFRDFDQELYSVDVAYARGPWVVRAEAMLDSWEVPNVADPARDLLFNAEAQWDVTTGFLIALRLGRIDFLPLDGGTGPAADWDRDVSRLEAALGYRLVRNAGVMLSGYRQAVRGKDPTHLTGLRLWYAF